MFGFSWTFCSHGRQLNRQYELKKTSLLPVSKEVGVWTYSQSLPILFSLTGLNVKGLIALKYTHISRNCKVVLRCFCRKLVSFYFETLCGLVFVITEHYPSVRPNVQHRRLSSHLDGGNRLTL